MMADCSDSPTDLVRYYRKLEEGYECVFGSRFVEGGKVIGYPAHKLLLNRLANAFIKFLFAVPTVVNALNNEPTVRGRDWSHIKCMLIAAAPISDTTALTAREIFGENALYQGYGQTEALLLSFMGPRQWFAEVEGSNPLRSCGLVIPGPMSRSGTRRTSRCRWASRGRSSPGWTGR
jgi:acyl-CoA synthetase (AMP-forming)/AMP-acid ligase II